VSAPSRTPEQRTQALERALASRQERALIRQRLKSGDLKARDVLEACEENQAWGALPIRAFLTALPGVGTAKAEAIMRDIDIAASRRLRGLGERQRLELLRVI
jgi:hypothetical protein